MNKLPHVTLIFPIRNEAAYIQGSLVSIQAQDYPAAQMEILIADGLSNDSTRAIITGFAALHPQLNIQILDNPGRIVPTGMNCALRLARGSIIIRVDGHCEIGRNYVKNCVNHLLVDNVDGVGGPMQTIGETRLSETIAVAMSSPFGVGGSAFRTVSGKTMLVDSVPFPAYTRKIIERVGLYDEELVRNQDDEYNYRIREAGGNILLAADVQSAYYSRGSLRSLWSQYYQYGYWKVRVLQKHPRQMSLRQFVPPLFIGALGGSVLHAIFTSFGPMLLALVSGAYLAANLASSVYTASQRGWRHLTLLPVCFAILHLGYGSGFLTGLVKFWNRWGDKKGKVPDFNPSGL